MEWVSSLFLTLPAEAAPVDGGAGHRVPAEAAGRAVHAERAGQAVAGAVLPLQDNKSTVF